MAPFPLFKLGYLAIKQVSKPIANYLKRRAKTSPFFSKFIIMPPAQAYNWMEVNFRLRLMGLGRAKKVERLSDKDAIELGGEMYGEFLVFTFAVLIFMSEYQRQANKDYYKEIKAQQEKALLDSKLHQITHIAEIQEQQIRDLQLTLDALTEVQKPKESSSTGKTSYVGKLFGSS